MGKFGYREKKCCYHVFSRWLWFYSSRTLTWGVSLWCNLYYFWCTLLNSLVTIWKRIFLQNWKEGWILFNMVPVVEIFHTKFEQIFFKKMYEEQCWRKLERIKTYIFSVSVWGLRIWKFLYGVCMMGQCVLKFKLSYKT